ncbi:MAG TPA: ribonuclease P protein component [Candidatus Dormibacteraeota bacterium]|nr:ribonuclease P protein component [Candidatus Dormibacteraeota bacterium]
MLAKQYRLRSGKDIAKVYRYGRYAGGGDLSIKYLKTGLPVSRAVVVVGKKVSKKASVRNRIRRRVAADLYKRWQTVDPGYDIVLSIHGDIADLPPASLSQKIEQALAKSGGLQAAKKEKDV